jgi:flagellar basal-body rod modification protein FlgD
MTSSVAQLSSQLASQNTAQSGSRAGSDRKLIAENFDTFLQLLITQLENQSPLDPLDTNEFTRQLVQFSSVEQEIRTNEQLEQLLSVSAMNATTAVVGYLGQKVTAEGANTEFNGTDAMKWGYNAAADASKTAVTIRDANGNIVHSDTVSLGKGKGSYSWDGYTDSGNRAPAGTYQITMDARTADGAAIQVKTDITGTVTGIDMSGDEPVLEVNGIRLPISSVKSISTQTNS